MKYTEYFETSRGSPLRLIYTHFTWSREEMRGTHFLLLDSDNSIYLVFITLNILNFDASPVQWQGVYPCFTDTSSLSLLYIESVKTVFKETNFISQRQRLHKNDWWECDFEFGPHPSRTFNSLSCTQLQATEVSPDMRKGIHSSLEWKFHQNVLPGAWLTCTLLGYILLQ